MYLADFIICLLRRIKANKLLKKVLSHTWHKLTEMAELEGCLWIWNWWKPGLSITFHEGLNALIGENDSGKTAIIDALKLVLLTQSNEYICPVEDDFYTDETGSAVTEFRIDCVLEKFTDNEAYRRFWWIILYLVIVMVIGYIKYLVMRTTIWKNILQKKMEK